MTIKVTDHLDQIDAASARIRELMAAPFTPEDTAAARRVSRIEREDEIVTQAAKIKRLAKDLEDSFNFYA